MILKTWTSSELINTDLMFWMRSTVTWRGVINDPRGNQMSPPEYMPRRYSVVEENGEGVYKIIGSVYYFKGFDSENSLQPLLKYATSEWKDLMVVKHNGTLADALLWNGMSQTIDNPNYNPTR